jgi:hypothetical protein
LFICFVQTIVVSATRHAMALIDAPAAIDVVTREQIESRGADNLFDAVRGETASPSRAGRSAAARPSTCAAWTAATRWCWWTASASAPATA